MESGLPNPQTDSPLFALPPELRNKIYEYVYETDTQPELWLLKAERPKDLLVTCKRAYAEARKMYIAKWYDYFADTVFTVSPQDPPGIAGLEWLEDGELENMINIRVTTAVKNLSNKNVVLELLRDSAPDAELPWQIFTIAHPSDQTSEDFLHAVTLKRKINMAAWTTVKHADQEYALAAAQTGRAGLKNIDGLYRQHNVPQPYFKFGSVAAFDAQFEKLENEKDSLTTRRRADLKAILEFCVGVAYGASA